MAVGVRGACECRSQVIKHCRSILLVDACSCLSRWDWILLLLLLLENLPYQTATGTNFNAAGQKNTR